MKKLFFVGGVLFVLIVIVGGVKFLLFPGPARVSTTEQTSDWKTYTDDSQKYSFKYPSGWFLESGNPNQLLNYDPEKAPGRQFDPEKDRGKIKIEIYTSGEPYQSIEEYIKKQEEEGEEMRLKTPVKYEAISIDNQRALKNVDTRWGSILTVYVQNPGMKQIHTIAAMPNYNFDKVIIDQIITTFKFLEQKETNLPTEAEEVSFSEYGVYFEKDPKTGEIGPVFGHPYVYGSKGPYKNYVKLIFTNESRCDMGQGEEPCAEYKFKDDMVLRISGKKVGDELTVIKVKPSSD